DASVLALEVGFHAEHPRGSDNEAVIGRLLEGEGRWRPTLGPEAVAGAFLGRAGGWRRLSETWPDPDLSEPDRGFERAARQCDNITAIEPMRR
ncbi:MAG: hypothetical protein WKF43_13530, partial [Acidimicrobiales bacterium]